MPMCVFKVVYPKHSQLPVSAPVLYILFKLHFAQWVLIALLNPMILKSGLFLATDHSLTNTNPDYPRTILQILHQGLHAKCSCALLFVLPGSAHEDDG